jgi:filamentous hemagglutinin family protein
VVPRVAAAQNISIDGRFSPAQTLRGPNYAIGANLGKQVGSNLFHSFGQFSLSAQPTPESATFTSTGSAGPISNVIGRVTGGNPSSINGRIQSNIAGANLYLINPSGIVFGPSATVNVSGSFQASTADYLKMSDGARFQATNPDGSTLSAAPPAAFGFLTATPAAITVNGTIFNSAFNLTPGLPSSPVTLGLVAGPVSMAGASLTSSSTGAIPDAIARPGIQVTSAAGAGEVPVDPRNTSAFTVTSFGPVSITRGSTLESINPGVLGIGGTVLIRSGALTIDASKITAVATGSGSGGSIDVTARQLTLTNAGLIGVGAFGTGNGGSVSLSVADQLSIVGSRILTDVAIVNGTPMQGGTPGNIAVTAGTLSIANGGEISAATFGASNGGSFFINVAGQLTIAGASGITSASFSTGKAGSVLAMAGNLTLLGNGVISAATFGPGNGGNVSIAVSGKLTIDGTSGNPAIATGISSQAGARSMGNAGSVTISAGRLSIVNNGEISSLTFGPGNGGSVTVVVGGLSIDGTGGNPVFLTGISSRANPGSRGQAGEVAVTAGTLSIVNNGEISSGTFGSGNGGRVTVGVADGLSINGTGGNPSVLTGITSEAGFGSAGNAGSVIVGAGSPSILPNGMISSSTFGTGNGGSVSVSVAGPLLIDTRSARFPGQTAGITSQANPGSSGNAGTISVSAGTVDPQHRHDFERHLWGWQWRNRFRCRRRRADDRRDNPRSISWRACRLHHLANGVRQRECRRRSRQRRFARDQEWRVHLGLNLRFRRRRRRYGQCRWRRCHRWIQSECGAHGHFFQCRSHHASERQGGYCNGPFREPNYPPQGYDFEQHVRSR